MCEEPEVQRTWCGNGGHWRHCSLYEGALLRANAGVALRVGEDKKGEADKPENARKAKQVEDARPSFKIRRQCVGF